MKNILIVTSNVSKINDNMETGVYFEEFAQPLLVFEATGYKTVTASINGGISPIDVNSLNCSNPNEWDRTKEYLENTKKLSEINPDEFDVVFFPGGHAPMFDIAESKEVKNLIEKFYNMNKIIAAVCHGSCALINATDTNGVSILNNIRVTGFSNKEENISKMAEFMPFSLEDKLKEKGAIYSSKKPWAEHVENDKKIITGQNQNSALKIAEAIVNELSC